MKNDKINRILIPTDYSPNAKRAMEYGMELAKKMGAGVVLFHSYHSPVIHASDITVLEKVKDDEEERINELVDQLKKKYGNDMHIDSKLEFGPAVDWIQNTVDSQGIDLIVMGTKGKTAAMDELVGSVASHVINEVDCPVLVIPDEVRQFNITEVLFAADFQTKTESNYHAALMHLLRVYDPNVSIVNFRENVEYSDEPPSKEEAKLGNLFKDYKHSFHFIEDGELEQAIFNFVAENHCDLIVVVTKHYSLWERIFHRSITKKLALHSHVPLFVMHEED